MCDYKMTIKAARVNAGMTQKDAAKALKVSQTTMNAWENGKRDVSEVALRALADLYRLPREALILPTISTK